MNTLTVIARTSPTTSRLKASTSGVCSLGFSGSKNLVFEYPAMSACVVRLITWARQLYSVIRIVNKIYKNTDRIWLLLASHLFKFRFIRSGDEFNCHSNSSSMVILFDALSHVIQPTYNISAMVNIHECHIPYARFQCT